jgi:hypothetical protein
MRLESTGCFDVLIALQFALAMSGSVSYDPQTRINLIYIDAPPFPSSPVDEVAQHDPVRL